MDIKTFVVPVLTIIGLAFMIASTATSMFTSGGTEVGIFNLCEEDGRCEKTDLGCDERENLRKSIAAFSILAVLSIAGAAILSIVRIFVAALAQPPFKMVTFVLCAATIFFSFFPWVFTSALFDAKICDETYKESDKIRIGAQMPLAVTTFVVAIIATVCEFLLCSPFQNASSTTSSSSAEAVGSSPA